ncbi:coniferyl aldehyde dehydrogenase [Halomonas sp. H10-59]|uniref:Aldehyde dehydrogenase n=1 Tax=Halomonas sp. H10-59 TaxID=2950874 RepID=A0AAU7KVR7_9GAMM
MNAPLMSPDPRTLDQLEQSFHQQRSAYLAAPVPSYRERIGHLKALANMLKDHQEAFVQAISDDFGNRSREETLFCEFVVVLGDIKDAIKHLKSWMKPQRRRVDHSLYFGARNSVIPQPLGVVGVLVPWNFPLNLSLAPLIGIFAAGNRALVKMSDRSPRLAQLLIDLSPDYFPEEKLKFFADDGELGPHFTRLPFDHLVFTGSTATGRKVMANAADNLTPVTLELGGKAPAIIAPDFSLAEAARRILFVKLLNAGQICTTVDYLFLPEGSVDALVDAAKGIVGHRYPDLSSPDYTSIIDDASFARLEATLEDARAKGARVIPLSQQQSDPETRKFAPHLVLDVTDDMEIMQREIFGPLLPVKTYRQPEEVIDYINARPRPLALYPFSQDRALVDLYIERIQSGGVSVNHALLHVGQHDLPFGGVGDSGMGHYHGRDGFITFSKMRPVYRQGPFDSMKLLIPPYTSTTHKVLKLMQWLVR